MSTFTPLPHRSDFLSNPSITRVADLPPQCKQNGDCSICWTPLTDYCKSVVLHGTHVFCEACITPWLEENDHCPYCREAVFSTIPPGIQRCYWSIRRYLVIDPKTIVADCLMFDEDILHVITTLDKQFHKAKATIDKVTRETGFSLLLTKYRAELLRLQDCVLKLARWRAEMYLCAPSHIVWSTFNFPKS
ncbi:hypothetical protein LTR95_007655 [Oleoguttula sp. CCFEE 5521]